MANIIFYNENDKSFPNSLPVMNNGKLNCKIRLRKDAKNSSGECALYVQVTLNRIVKRVLLNIKVGEADFDKDKQRVKSKHKFYNDYNLIIEKKLADVNAVEVNYRLQGKDLTIDKLLEELNNPSGRLDFIKFWEDEMVRQKDLLKQGTYRQQMTVLNKVRSFKSPIMFHDINQDLVSDLKVFYKKKGNSQNTISSLIKSFKKYLHLANQKGMNTPIDFREIKNKTVRGSRTFLSEIEVKSLYQYWNLPNINETYKNILSMFLFSCFTGIRFSDAVSLTPNNFVDDTLVFTAEKTGKFQRIKLNNAALEFIGKKKTFPEFTNEYINRELKDVAKAVGITKLVTFHVSRHTFATLFLIRGGRIEHLQKILGHSKIEDTMIYVHIVEDITNNQIDNMNGILDIKL
jgi:integrase/recombinase XerD